MADQFEIGRAYYATPAMPGAKQRIVIPIGRDGDQIQFAFVEDLANASCDILDGAREYVTMDVDGQRYVSSSACVVPASESAKVLDLIRGSRA